MTIFWFAFFYLFLAVGNCFVVEKNDNSVFLFGKIFYHELGFSFETEGCNLTQAAQDSMKAQEIFTDEFTPSQEEYEALRKCLVKEPGIGKGRWFCIDGLRPIIRAIKNSLLDYIIVLDKEEDDIQNLDVSIKGCLPFLQYMKMSYDIRGLALYRLSEGMTKSLSGIQPGIIGRDGSREWHLANGTAMPHLECTEKNDACCFINKSQPLIFAVVFWWVLYMF